MVTCATSAVAPDPRLRRSVASAAFAVAGDLVAEWVLHSPARAGELTAAR